mgnify:CR=1
MINASICEHANSGFIFATTSSCQIFLESSEELRKYRWSRCGLVITVDEEKISKKMKNHTYEKAFYYEI